MSYIKHLLIAKNAPYRAKYALQDMGYGIVESYCLSGVHKSLAYHPDMQIVNCGIAWVCAPECYEYYKPFFDEIGISLIRGDKNPGFEYPDDVMYNVAVTGEYAIHNFKYTDSVFADNCTCTQINVKQGYSKCSVCVLSGNAIITADTGIQKSAADAGMDVLCIQPGGILLEGYDYGFIGGASGAADDYMFFCGDVFTHTDGVIITDFCKRHGKEPVSLCSGKLVDVGTIVALG